jgi:hypothetical protein
MLVGVAAMALEVAIELVVADEGFVCLDDATTAAHGRQRA